MPNRERRRSPFSSVLRRVLSVLAEIVVALYVVLDGIIAPLFRPIMRGLSKLQLIRRLERGIAALPAYVILVLLVVPFGIAELAKVYAVVLMSEEHFRSGMTIFIGAYIVSILVCERTFYAGKSKLMTIPWFAKLYAWVMSLRDHVLDWLRPTRAWRAAAEFRQRIRFGFRRFRVRLRSAFGMKSKGLIERP